MAKELEAFRIMVKDNGLELPYHNTIIAIENALKRLENHEQNENFNKDVLNYAFLNEKDKIKKLKAFEIMSKYDLKKSDITRFETYEEFVKTMYLGIDGKIYGECPSKEEFDLLKEVLL